MVVVIVVMMVMTHATTAASPNISISLPLKAEGGAPLAA